MNNELSKKLMADSRRRIFIGLGAGLLLVAAMALDTTVVKLGSAEDVREQVFSPDAYGANEYPRIQQYILENAANASEVITAVIDDKAAAGERYGVASGIGHVIPVRFTAEVVGEARSGIYQLAISGWPEGYSVRVQTGPAINGTDLRDAPGDIDFGQFTNQIEFQNVGAALNRAMKADILDPIDTSSLSGEVVEVVGVFKLINPKNWLLTPVKLEVK